MRLAAPIVLALLLAVLPTAAAANVIWPAVILGGRMLAWWVVGLSLVIESVFVWGAFRLTPGKALLATIAANAVSAMVGLFVLPYLTMFLELGLYHSGLAAKIGWDTFSLEAWLVTFALAVLINLALELAVFRFGYKLPIGKRAVGLIALANVITVGLAFASLDIVPDPDYGEVSPGVFAK